MLVCALIHDTMLRSRAVSAVRSAWGVSNPACTRGLATAAGRERVFVVGVGMTVFEKPGRREKFDYPDMVGNGAARCCAWLGRGQLNGGHVCHECDLDWYDACGSR